jgi:hypothetical protein
MTTTYITLVVSRLSDEASLLLPEGVLCYRIEVVCIASPLGMLRPFCKGVGLLYCFPLGSE